MPEPSFLQRLTERKLVQWAVAYLAGAFVVFQGVDVMAEPWSISPALQRAVHVLLLAGLLVTLVLAWYHGEKGRQRVSGPELLMVAALLLIAGGVLSVLRPGGNAEPATETLAGPQRDSRPVIAVLPLANLSGREEDAWFTDGMHGQILTQLYKIGSLGVISGTSVQEYRDTPKNLRTIGRELGARYIAEGDVLRAGTEVRVNIQLIDAETDTHLWADSYDRPLSVETLFFIQSDIARAVAVAVQATLTPEEERALQRGLPTDNLEAYEAYLQGEYHSDRRDDEADAFPEAVRSYQAAVQLDPSFALAHAALANAYVQMAIWGLGDPRELWSQAEQRARSALAMDTTLANAHLALAHPQWVRDWDWEGGERTIQRSIRLGPSHPLGHVVYADLLMAQGRIEEGREEGRLAVALDPLSSPTLGREARWAFHSRRYEEAVELGEVLVTRDPGNRIAAYFVALSSLFGGRPEQVPRLLLYWFADPATLAPEDRAERALFLSLLGEADSARVEIAQVVSSTRDQYLHPEKVWATYASLGEKDEAFSWLERSIEVQAYQTVNLGVNPLADPLRDDPRYQALLERLGLGHLRTRFDSLASAPAGIGS